MGFKIQDDLQNGLRESWLVPFGRNSSKMVAIEVYGKQEITNRSVKDYDHTFNIPGVFSPCCTP